MRHPRGRYLNPNITAPMCGECGAPTSLTTGREIYPHLPHLARRHFYVCNCGAYVGCHASGGAFGIPAGLETRRMRQLVHAVFDPFWKRAKRREQKAKARAAAYSRLQRDMGLSIDECHIGRFDAEQCKKAINAIAEWGK